MITHKPSGAILKLKDRAHAYEFVKKMKSKGFHSNSLFEINGDITIDLKRVTDNKIESYTGKFINK